MNLTFISIITCALVLNCDALNCRTDGGPKEDVLKSAYMGCMKKADGRSNESNRQMNGELGPYRGSGGDHDYDDKTMKNNNRRMGDDGMNRRFDGMSRNEGVNRRDDGMKRTKDYMNDGSSQSDESTSEFPKFNGYHSTAPPRRFRREQRADGRRNSGHRSQYNPNTSQRPDMFEESFRSDRNGSDANMTGAGDKGKTCIMHCFLQDLEMTGDNGMPDRYMVTHVITKDVKNEDLRDFLTESIEECFQILYNENTQDKCEFSKNLMMCLSEKGRSNCDDWKDDTIHF